MAIPRPGGSLRPDAALESAVSELFFPLRALLLTLVRELRQPFPVTDFHII